MLEATEKWKEVVKKQLVSEMTSSSLTLRQKSLRFACQQMSAPKEIASFLDAGIVEALNMAGRDEDDEVRTLTTSAAETRKPSTVPANRL